MNQKTTHYPSGPPRRTPPARRPAPSSWPPSIAFRRKRSAQLFSQSGSDSDFEFAKGDRRWGSELQQQRHANYARERATKWPTWRASCCRWQRSPQRCRPPGENRIEANHRSLSTESLNRLTRPSRNQRCGSHGSGGGRGGAAAATLSHPGPRSQARSRPVAQLRVALDRIGSQLRVASFAPRTIAPTEGRL